MKVKLACFAVGLCLLTAVTSCSKSSPAPVAPSATAKSGTDANADGSTLKVAAPALSSPANGSSPSQGGDTISLVVNNAPPKYGNAAITYRFQVFNPAGAKVADALVSGTTYQVTATLANNTRHTWKVRAESQGEFGPFSTKWSFIAPSNDGYIRGNELYDPLVNGSRSEYCGTDHVYPRRRTSFPCTAQPGPIRSSRRSPKVNLHAHHRHGYNTDGDKTKMFSMAEGYDDSSRTIALYG
jgi:hypothetical protein